METKKQQSQKEQDIRATGKLLLYYFNQMFKIGGKYEEKKDAKIYKVIYFKLDIGMTFKIPVTKAEYVYWRSIKPQLQRGDKIKNA